MFLNVITDFKDGRTCYYEGERVSVNNFEPEALQRAIGAGWIAEFGSDAVPLSSNAEFTIDVHDANHAHDSTEVN